MIRLQKVKKGEEIRADHHNALVDAILERTPLSFALGFLTKTPHGFHVRGNRGGSGGSTTIRSLQLIDASTEDEKKIRVTYGVIMGEAPEGMSLGDNPPYLVDVSGEGALYAKVVIDEMGEVTSRTIVNLDGPPEDDEEYTYYTQIGSYSVDGDALNIAQARFGPIDAAVIRNYFATDSDTERFMLIWGMYGFVD